MKKSQGAEGRTAPLWHKLNLEMCEQVKMPQQIKQALFDFTGRDELQFLNALTSTYCYTAATAQGVSAVLQ